MQNLGLVHLRTLKLWHSLFLSYSSAFLLRQADSGLSATPVDSSLHTTKDGTAFRSHLQTSIDRVSILELNEAEMVVLWSARRLITSSEANVSNVANLILFHHLVQIVKRVVYVEGWNPDWILKSLLDEVVNWAEFVNKDFDVFGVDFTGELDLVGLGLEVSLGVDVGQLLLLAEHKFVEEHVDAVIVDKVSTDRELIQFAVFIREYTVNNGFQACLTDAIVTNIKELQWFVLLEHFTDGASSVNI